MEVFLGKQISPAPLGRLLMEQGILSQDVLERALITQRKNGGRLGEILVAEKLLTPWQLAEAVARHHGKPCINLVNTPCDTALLKQRELDDYVRLEVLPVSRRKGRTTLAATDISFPVIDWAFKKFGNNFDLVITSPRDILWTIEREFGAVIDIESRYHLSRNAPHHSVQVLLTGLPRLASVLTFIAFVALLAVFRGQALRFIFIAANLVFTMTYLFKFVLFWRGRKQRVWQAQSPLPPMRDQDLPIYTILVPLYKEHESLPNLFASLGALDYPASKLDIKLIVESDDELTINTAKALKPEANIEIIRVPYSLPRTKPKACNYALKFARGEFVTIYDAEDQPDPQQIKKAVHAFRSAPKEVICLQARLNYYNRNDSWLTRFFALEYANWFDFLLPGLQSFDIPIPLGGTSNHISLSRLKALGQWDPYNVTEDADLGVRIALSGERTQMLSSLTLEEAPSTLRSWLPQRTRWIKGYIQTWLVHMRHPGEMLRGFGWRGLLGFHLFIGGPCFIFLMTPVLIAVTILHALGWLPLATAFWANTLAFGNLVLGYVIHAWLGFAVIKARRWRHLTTYAFAFPFYWLLHSYASFLAVFQLISNPFHWDKTSHGMSQGLRNSARLAGEFR